MYSYTIDVDDYTLVMINDILRLFIIQVSVQIMFFMKNDTIELFSSVFIENLLFILLGVFIYWFVFNKVFKVTNKSSESNDSDKQETLRHYQEIYKI